ncbi:hypothetical protein L228DRAFT_102498 [Xylona heveae TC161]|uniref:Uncharacterized protein n=1 Tax=Xylona heveae (strain CBS 132557 / TC161) TaxID=1328760 RepID=A0A161TQQ0_XYLHT|nr:hypothetical protein L228DRAFT_102498 [Xylona heveae TC161]KZF24696.1 hypothetical protein L228DRAFT_102498 [Xylona heveae TC161]
MSRVVVSVWVYLPMCYIYVYSLARIHPLAQAHRSFPIVFATISLSFIIPSFILATIVLSPHSFPSSLVLSFTLPILPFPWIYHSVLFYLFIYNLFILPCILFFILCYCTE